MIGTAIERIGAATKEETLMVEGKSNEKTDHATPDENQGQPPLTRLERISIDTLVLDPTFQVRTKLDEKAISRYKEAYKFDQLLDPVRVAEVDGMFILVDGWHRITALQRLTKEYVDVKIEPMTREEALWAAATANARHGVPLSKKDHFNVFAKYIEAGKHIKRRLPTRIVYKTYRDIADELPINRSYGTIRNWMTEHYPDIAKAMGGPSPVSDEYADIRHASETPEHPNTVKRLAGELLTHFQSASDPDERGMMIGQVRNLLNRMEAAPGWTEPPSDDAEF
jgi:hypothetical protein